MPQELYVYIGLAIRQFRKQRGLSQLELAKALGKSRAGYVSDYETAKIKIDIDTLYQIATVLKVHVYDLLPE